MALGLGRSDAGINRSFTRSLMSCSSGEVFGGFCDFGAGCEFVRGVGSGVGSCDVEEAAGGGCSCSGASKT